MDTEHFQQLLPESATFSATGVFSLARHSVPELAKTYGTPLYLFDQTTIEHACQAYKRAFHEAYHASECLILYASKAYLSPLLARVLAAQGLGLDVVSGGELLLAQQVDFPLDRVSFHGNNKSLEELRLAIQAGVGRIVLDNWNELENLTQLARESASQPRVLLRVAPEVETATHHYLQTGHASSKFGFHLENGEARAALLRIVQDKQLDLLGLHAHAGTMLRDPQPYASVLERLLALASDIHSETGWWPREISPGGGWGIDTPGALDIPEISVLAATLQTAMLRGVAAAGSQLSVPRLIIEPGRSIIARAGVAIYRIGARKVTPGGTTYLFVDGGMADNIRPALYGAVYSAFAVEHALDQPEETVCIAGRYCESGDFLIEQVQLPRLYEGSLLALPTSGAYCLPMASNYNLVPRPAALLISDQHVAVMERRETHADLFARYTF